MDAVMKFAKTHEWIKIEGDFALIGITEYAQSQLGDIVFVELPSKGDTIKQSMQFGTIESTKAASEIYSPLSGDVVDINADLIDNPQWMNEDPQGKAWMVKIKIGNQEELSNLLDQTSYEEFIGKESH